mmetsp:Transcript_21380/g.52818  ORF Transcript_21380/g.52818 Transcript_21380/m.52818 type:complete len:208 (+) Transcript_21380:3341-3964(+)
MASAVMYRVDSSSAPRLRSTAAVRNTSAAAAAQSATLAPWRTSPRFSSIRLSLRARVARSAGSSSPTSSKAAWSPASSSITRPSSSGGMPSWVASVNTPLTSDHSRSAASVTMSAHACAASGESVRRVSPSAWSASDSSSSSSDAPASPPSPAVPAPGAPIPEGVAGSPSICTARTAARTSEVTPSATACGENMTTPRRGPPSSADQ